MLSDFRPLVSGRAEVHYVLFARFCILHYAFIDIVIGRGSCQSIVKGFMYDISDRLTIGKPWRKKKQTNPIDMNFQKSYINCVMREGSRTKQKTSCWCTEISSVQINNDDGKSYQLADLSCQRYYLDGMGWSAAVTEQLK